MAYELATSINLTYDMTGKQSFLQSVERIINVGFTNLDYNFLDMMNGTERFWGDDYKEWMYDEHIQPYMGTVDWDDIIYGLDSIHYNHFFTYEAHNSTRTLPDELVDDKLVFLYKLGQYLVGQSKL